MSVVDRQERIEKSYTFSTTHNPQPTTHNPRPMFKGIEFWGFLAGLGLFLLGMFMLEQGLRGLGSRSMKKFLREQTYSPLRGVFAGTLVTAFLQSSSLVGLIVLAFVGAGILELRNALGIIFGSNLGTTFTGWIVALLGFKLDLMHYAQPLLALGALGSVFFARESKIYFYSNLLLGIGLLLMGLSEMTGSFNALTGNIDISFFRGHNPLVYFFGGALLTALIQSSSVAMMIVLSAMHAGILSLTEAAPLVVGADLGTTSTVLLGALKGSDEKRRVALSHFFFNVGTDSLALLISPLLIYFLTVVAHIEDPLIALVAFHSSFNLLGIAIYIPLVGQFARFLEWLVPGGTRGEGELCSYIGRVPAKVPDAAIEAVRKELTALIIQAFKLNLHCFKINETEVIPEALMRKGKRRVAYEDDYALLKRAAGEILGYTYAVQGGAMEEEDSRELTQLNHAVRNVSYAVKFIKDIRHNLAEFRHSDSDVIITSQTELQNEVKFIYRKLAELILNRNPELAVEHYLELKKEIREGYERFIQNIYSVSGEDKIDDEETSSLLNVNRSVYLSTSAFMESTRVLLSIGENPDVSPGAVIAAA